MKQLLLFTSLQSFLFVLPQCGHFNDFAHALISHCSISAFILVWFRFFLFWLTWAFFWDSYRCTPGSLPALSVHITAKETKENIYFQTRHHFHSAAWAPSIAELLWSAPCGTGSSVVSALTCKCHLTWLWPTCCSKPTLVFYLQSVSLSDSEWGEYAQFTNPNDKLVVLEVSFFVNEAERVCGESQTAAGLPLITLAVISFALVVFSD